MVIELFKKKLQVAFDELEKEHNITARQNFMCCNSCGVDAIGDENPNAVGYCFYHEQDYDHLLEFGKCYLTFGNDIGGDAAIPIGKKIVEILNKHKIHNIWDGDPNVRILIIAHTEE